MKLQFTSIQPINEILQLFEDSRMKIVFIFWHTQWPMTTKHWPVHFIIPFEFEHDGANTVCSGEFCVQVYPFCCRNAWTACRPNMLQQAFSPSFDFFVCVCLFMSECSHYSHLKLLRASLYFTFVLHAFTVFFVLVAVSLSLWVRKRALWIPACKLRLVHSFRKSVSALALFRQDRAADSNMSGKAYRRIPLSLAASLFLQY